MLKVFFGFRHEFRRGGATNCFDIDEFLCSVFRTLLLFLHDQEDAVQDDEHANPRKERNRVAEIEERNKSCEGRSESFHEQCFARSNIPYRAEEK